MEPQDQDQDRDQDWERLARYLAGESSAAERTAIDAWLAEDPSRRELLTTLQTGWIAASRPRGAPTNVDGAWQRMSTSMAAVERKRTSRTYAPLLRVAAALVIVAGSMWAWRATRKPTIPFAPPRTFATKAGEVRRIRLEDKTEVILGVSSHLEVAAGYGGSSRDMVLEGEALFRVKHDELRPFRVHAGGAVTEDLGTDFSVRAYEGEDTVRVVVQTGSVSIIGAGDSARAVVRPGQTALVAGSVAVVSSMRSVDALMAFSRGQLVFDDAPMQRVAEELERWYDVDVRVPSPALAKKHVTVSFSGERIDDVLRVIALSIGAQVQHKGRVVTFTPHAKP